MRPAHGRDVGVPGGGGMTFLGSTNGVGLVLNAGAAAPLEPIIMIDMPSFTKMGLR